MFPEQCSINNGVPFRGNFELRPLGVATGERRQRDPCLKHTYKNTTCWPATAYDVTTGANHSIKGRRENTSSSSSSSSSSMKREIYYGKGKNDFLLLLWRALARRLRDVCIRVLVI